MDDATKTAITDALVELVVDMLPDAGLRTMYGGTVIEMVPGKAASRIGGIFAYAAHVSLEFTHGAGLADPDGLLEGSGKARRHLKLHSLADIAGKDCAGFLRQAAG